MRKWIAVALPVVVLSVVFIPNRASAQEGGDSARKVVARVIPQYPSLARTMRIQGNVRADVLVAANGKVKSIEMKGGHPLLVQSAEDALHQWKWEPASRESHEIIELKFTP